MNAKTKAPDRDQLVADKRAYGSLRAEMDEDVARVRACAAELAAAIEQLNARYIAADERWRAILAAVGRAEAPRAPMSPARIVELNLPALIEYAPRVRMNMRPSPEEQAAIDERRQCEAAIAARALPRVVGPANWPIAGAF